MRIAFAVLFLVCTAAHAKDRSDCRGLKSAHCTCQVLIGRQLTTGNNEIWQPKGEGTELFRFRIPGKCYNQQVDWVQYHRDRGCWLDCRQAFGVDHPPHPEVLRLKTEAGKKLRALGACGGWNSAPLLFAAGTNKFRTCTGSPIGVGTGGTVKVENGKKVCK